MTGKNLRARAASVGKSAPAAAPGVKAPRAEPVRLSVDLPPVTYRAVTAFPEDMGIPAATGRARIPTVEVFRALAEELAADEALRRRVADRIITLYGKK